MTVIGIAMVRDEDDIIGEVIKHLYAEGVDHLIIADNLSTDGTAGILDAWDDVFVTVVHDPVVAYNQAEKMTALAGMAADMGADWVLPFDADEVFYAPDTDLAKFFAQADGDIVHIKVYDHIATHDDPDDPNPLRRIGHRRTVPQRMAKVAFRPHPDVWVHMGNHDVDRPGTRIDGLEGRHFQYRCLEQMARKVRQGNAAYAASDLHRRYGSHWRELAELSDEALSARWNDMCGERGLIYDPAPVS